MLKLSIAIGLVYLALAASPAQANIYTQVLRAYEANGGVPACQFTSQQLESALKGIDTYGQQYFADFTSAVQSALAARATGACSPRRKRAAVAAGLSNEPLALGPVTAATDASLPAPILLMAGFLVLLGAVAALAGLWWWRGWNPRWASRWQHAWGEAGYRAEGRAAELEDWLRRSR